MPADGSTCQLIPPSSVAMIRNLPFGGSETARPRRSLKNVMQS
jgi:hypothetical protein